MAAFVPLFSLRVSHEFLAGAACAALDFVATDASRKLAANCGMLIRGGSGGVSVYYDPEHPAALAGDDCFDFRVHVVDPDFHTYTDAPLCTAGSILAFDSRNADGEGRLCRGDHVSAADLCAPGELPVGLVPAGMPPLCVARIAAAAPGRRYEIPFRTRRTHWQYFVTGKDVDGAALTVAASAGGAADFEYRGDVGLPNGRVSSVFRSTLPLPLLHEQPLQLSLRQRDNGTVLIRRLPLPSSRSLASEGSGGERRLLSQMFVNL